MEQGGVNGLNLDALHVVFNSALNDDDSDLRRYFKRFLGGFDAVRTKAR